MCMHGLLKRLVQLGLVSTILVGLATGCSDDPVAPNTDLGLRVWAEVRPSVVRISDPDAVVRIRIYAANATSHGLRIPSGGPPYVFSGDVTHTRGLSYGYRLARGSNRFTAGPTTDWGWDSVYVFRPFESGYVEQSVQIKAWNRDGTPPDTGEYRVRSFFNAREGASTTFRIEP